ncbi:S8 family serine peptidase [Sulfitobacter sp. MF3-043]|uniref:S8 family serine peptidase n=1 Tax=Sulfitobacter sediminivivens TaxID=3252902 RepID=UPI0036D930F6
MKVFSLVIALLLWGAGPVWAQSAVPVAELEWRSASQSDAELAIELSTLYVVLYNSGNLTVREATTAKSPFVEILLREEGVFMGSFFPEALDALLCDLNPDVCSRTRKAVSEKTISDVAAHIGGFTISRGRWATRAGTTILIPDYLFESVTVLSRIEVPADWRAEDYVVPAGVECSAWKASCEDLVKRFNPTTIKRPTGTIKVTVPQLRLATTVALKADGKSSFSKALTDLGMAQPGSKTEREFVSVTERSAEWNQIITTESPNDLALDAMQKNLRPVGSVSKYAAEDEPYFDQQIDLFKLINHPFAASGDMPDEYKRPIGVVVIDSRLLSGHCDWPNVSTTDGTELVAPVEEFTADVLEASNDNTTAAIPRVDCAKIDELALSDSDHAASVGGLIASQENGKGMIGLNPAAQLRFLEFDKNAVAETQIENLVNQLQQDIPEGTRVANMSFGILQIWGNFDEVEAALAAQGSRMLFVAAAGNEGQAMDDESCRILPACLNGLPNVITVVGLNADLADPRPWQTDTAATNTNPEFDVGAIAQNVLSTVSNNRFAHKSGTSIAAPQVAAAASLIFSAGEFIYRDAQGGAQLAPKIVKDRLIYTADFFGELSGNVSAGRLNIGRSMHLGDAQFELFDGRRIVGQVKQAPDEFSCRTPHENQKFQKWWNVRRLVFNEARNRHIIFRHIGGDLGDRYGTLERYPSCNVTTASAPVKVQTSVADGFKIVEFRFADIKDYTSPLFDE